MTGIDEAEWEMVAGSAARMVDTAHTLTDDDLRGTSGLPGWTRALVLTHVRPRYG